MKSYNGFSPEQRIMVGDIIKEKVKTGELQEAKECKRCKQTKGIIHYHLEDYSLPVTEEKIEHLCWRCHMMHHSRRRSPDAVAQYFEDIKQGKQFPPVFRHNFDILNKEHGVK